MIQMESRNAEILASIQTRDANRSIILLGTAITTIIDSVAQHTLPHTNLEGDAGN